MKHPLSREARCFINQFQGGFPIARRPYLQVAAKLGMKESTLITLVDELLSAGYLSRFGPLFDAARMGGSHVLAAMAVPERRFGKIAARVNRFPAVAHNYRRQHRLNMWFVVSAESPRLVEQTMDQIADQAGLTVYRFPKAHEFYVGLFLELDEEGEVVTVSRSRGESTAEYALSSIDRDLVVACQDGLPVIPEPYAEIARQVSLTEEDLHVRLRRLLRHGVVRRIGAIPNHYRLGLRANSMTVWNIVDERAVALGERVGALPFVSHCYLRPRYPGVWEYNLFAMVHGPDRGSVERKRARIRELLGPHLLDEDSLYSTEILKKSGLRLAA